VLHRPRLSEDSAADGPPAKPLNRPCIIRSYGLGRDTGALEK
jgi:hypothetical protein